MIWGECKNRKVARKVFRIASVGVRFRMCGHSSMAREQAGLFLVSPWISFDVDR